MYNYTWSERLNKQQFYVYFSFHSARNDAIHVAHHDTKRIKWLHLLETLCCDYWCQGLLQLLIFFKELAWTCCSLVVFVGADSKIKTARVSFQLRKSKNHTCTENMFYVSCNAVWSIEVTDSGGTGISVSSKVDFCLSDCWTWVKNGFSGEQCMVWGSDTKTWHLFDVLH